MQLIKTGKSYIKEERITNHWLQYDCAMNYNIHRQNYTNSEKK